MIQRRKLEPRSNEQNLAAASNLAVQEARIWGPASLAVLTLLCSLFVFRRVLNDFGNLGVGLIGDSRLFIWSIDYVAHEVRHGRFPWMVSNIYPQIGSVHFFSDTTIPGVGFLLLPVTLIFGAVAAHNVSYILAPMAAALISRRLAELLGLSRFGAFVAGFSMAACPYMAAHALGHANLIHLWIVPLAALGFAQLSLGNRSSAVLCLALSYGAGLWFSSEIVAIVALVAALGIADLLFANWMKKIRRARSRKPERNTSESPIRLAGWKGRSGGARSEVEMGPASMKESPIRLAGWKGRSGGARSEVEMGPASMKESLELCNDADESKAQPWIPSAIRTLVLAASLSIVIGVPVLYGNFLAPNHFAGKRHQLPNTYVTDGLNIIVPTGAQALSPDSIPLGDPPKWDLDVPFTGGIAEQSGYLSVLGVLFIGLRLWSRVTKDEASLETTQKVFRGVLCPAGLVDRLTLSALVLSIGPRLHLWGKDTDFRMPFFIIDRTPVLRSILSGRMSAIVSLGFALMLATELSRKHRPRKWIALGLGSVVLQLPTATFPSHIAGPDSLMLRDYTAAKCQRPAGNRRTRVLIVPNYESNMGFSWLLATSNEIELVRTRWFARNYRVDGREFKLDVYLKGSGGVDEVVEELAELKVDCIVVIPNRLTPLQTEMMKPIMERWSN